jgi:putative protease
VDHFPNSFRVENNRDLALPAILAPAGSKPSFLAALAAGAEAVYCGLKQFSARMEAQNFTLEELRGLVELARVKGVAVYVTLNTLIKPDELDAAGRLLDQLNRDVHPDAVIVQDLAMAQLVRQSGFAGEVHWSTLANVSFPAALQLIQEKLPVDAIVLPRELTIDEIKAAAAACPPGLNLEVFIHGALCYGVSGRCYWSSFLGGKSGLRGRCVQPCRRVYSQGREGRRFFSCLDLSIDTLVKVLLGIPQIRAWKIEGRKKGPHYVYYVVTAYRLLRDHGGDPQAKKDALHFLSRALGRPGTHYNFLPQRPQNPVNSAEQTGSGLFIGRIKGTAPRIFFSPHQELLAGDLLRVGYEDAPGHRIERLGRAVPKGGRYALPAAAGGTPQGTPVFLIDRREKALEDLIKVLEANLPAAPPALFQPSGFRARLPSAARVRVKPGELQVYRRPLRQAGQGRVGLWLSREALEMMPEKMERQAWWWLPPVLFPDDEPSTRALIEAACSRGGRTFVLNDPWQVSLFAGGAPGLKLWAGPFCNLANPLALETAAALGFSGAIVSPELAAGDILKLPRCSPLPLGVVVDGNWPLCVARTGAAGLQLEQPFRSPKGEEAWAVRYGSLYWVFPNWRIDLRNQLDRLHRAGYSLFVHLFEPVPSAIRLKDRPGLWNWEGELV